MHPKNKTRNETYFAVYAWKNADYFKHAHNHQFSHFNSFHKMFNKNKQKLIIKYYYLLSVLSIFVSNYMYITVMVRCFYLSIRKKNSGSQSLIFSQ